MMQPPQRLYPSLNAMTSSGRYTDRMQSGNIFGTFDDPFLQARAAQVALAEMDVKNVNVSAASMLRQADMFAGYPTPVLNTSTGTVDFDPNSVVPSSSNLLESGLVSSDSMASLQQVMAMQQHHYQQAQFPQYPSMPSQFSAAAAVITAGACAVAGNNMQNSLMPRYPLAAPTTEMIDMDPRELERFAEHFKQRRIKLGVTQADVGKALAHLKMPGVGSLSQSTICRFESLTLSHNNMVALKPILHSWLEKAEDAIKTKETGGDSQGILPNTEKKRKRTSIAAPEKRVLEEYFRQQPRPTGDRISAIAEKLDLKKNVVRVWFCNQRQKQKRSRNQGGGSNSTSNGGMSSRSNANGANTAGKCEPFGEISLPTSTADNNTIKNVPNLSLFYA
uniref:POU domain protein n=2 Tax=Acrobeloides nanus TaxID=290746 RepID=A0A914D580_9BILA